MMFSKEFEETRQFIEQFAISSNHEFVTIEHLLLGLIDDDDAKVVLQACEVDLLLVKEELMAYIEAYVPKNSKKLPTTSKAFLRVLQRAIWHN